MSYGGSHGKFAKREKRSKDVYIEDESMSRKQILTERFKNRRSKNTFSEDDSFFDSDDIYYAEENYCG